MLEMNKSSEEGGTFRISIGLAFVGGFADASSYLLAQTFTGHLTDLVSGRMRWTDLAPAEKIRHAFAEIERLKAQLELEYTYLRLNVFPLEVPALRNRKEDIPLLAAHFLDKAARKLKVWPARLTQAHLVQLQGYDWPGNVRELQNRIERALILAENGVMYLDLPASYFSTGMAAESPVARARPADVHILSDIQLRQLERDNLLAGAQ